MLSKVGFYYKQMKTEIAITFFRQLLIVEYIEYFLFISCSCIFVMQLCKNLKSRISESIHRVTFGEEGRAEKYLH